MDTARPKHKHHNHAPSEDHPSNEVAHSAQTAGSVPWWKPLAEWLGVAAVIFYAVITFLMWRDAHRNFRIDEQAWIKVSADTLKRELIKEGVPLSADVTLTNTGKTFARNIHYQEDVVILPSAESVPFDYATGELFSVGILQPNQAEPYQDMRANEALTKGQADDLLNGHAYIAVYVRGQYDDIFGKTHWFGYCRWQAYYAPAAYATRGCTLYANAGDGPIFK